VTNLVVDEQRGACLGVIVERGGLFGRKRLLPFRDVVAIGPAFMVARDRDSLVRPRDVPEINDGGQPTPIKGTLVVTSDGQRLGRIVDVRIDECGGRVEGYELSRGGVAGLFAKRGFLPAAGPFLAGHDAVLAPAGAADWIQPASSEETSEPLTSARV
jgi:uncharacterized protein YrrD